MHKPSTIRLIRFLSVSTRFNFKHQLNYKFIRENTQAIAQDMVNRNIKECPLSLFNALYDTCKSSTYQLSQLKKKRNALARTFKGNDAINTPTLSSVKDETTSTILIDDGVREVV